MLIPTPRPAALAGRGVVFELTRRVLLEANLECGDLVAAFGRDRRAVVRIGTKGQGFEAVRQNSADDAPAAMMMGHQPRRVALIQKL